MNTSRKLGKSQVLPQRSQKKIKVGKGHIRLILDQEFLEDLTPMGEKKKAPHPQPVAFTLEANI